MTGFGGATLDRRYQVKWFDKRWAVWGMEVVWWYHCGQKMSSDVDLTKEGKSGACKGFSGAIVGRKQQVGVV